MGKLFKITALFLYLFLMYVVSSLIFTKGFLLKRDVVQRESSCRVDFAQYSDGQTHGAEGCWLHRRFDKAIFVIIDALRFDFLTRRSESMPFYNKLSVVYELVDRKPMNSRVYRFLADPPTTTVQRLQGLTTGSLPTFVDVGTNFGSSEINEDNFIDQTINRNKKITFLGDETWVDLYPRRFHTAFPMPSLNLKDLHAVDNAVLDRLYDEMKKPDWDILIAHFLGVDHCGHTYGPNSRAMEDKLLQMNEMLRNVTEQMDKNTVLFLLGDHGMTSTGDHGGDSVDEVEAGLFVYSPAQITATKHVKDHYKTIDQVDLVPTVSLLLGLPIPFSNLGTIITDLFNHCDWSKDSHIKEVYHTIEALRLNAKQISLYIDAYTETSTDLNRPKLQMLQQYLQNTEQKLQNLVTELFIHNFAENAHQELHNIEAEYKYYIKQIREMCQEVWAKFDLTSMTLGALMLVVTLSVNIYVLLFECNVTEDKGMGTLVIVLTVSSVFIGFGVIQAVFLEGKAVHILSFILGVFDLIVIFIIMIVVYSNSSQRTTTKKNKKSSIISQLFTNSFTLEHFFSCLCVLFTMYSFFTNSFVVYEDSVVLFLTETMVWVFGVKCMQGLLREGRNGKDTQRTKSKATKNFDLMKFLTQPVAVVIILTFMCNFCLRLSKNFRSCREEQIVEGNCTNSVFMQPLSSVGQTVEGNKDVRYFICVTCLVLFSYLTRKWMTNYGNLNGGSVSVVCGRYLVPAACGATVLHWAVQGLPEKLLNTLPVWQQVLLPQMVYILVGLSMAAFFIKPLFIYVLPRQQDKVSISTTGESSDLIKKVYNHLKTSLSDSSVQQNGSSGGQETPVVFGLGTAYSASFVYLGSVTYILLSLLLGDGIAPSLLTGAMALVMFLELFSIAVRICKESDLLVPGVVTISLLTTNYFYATGHQATIPSIKFDAAFIGFHGNWNNHIIPATLISLNMFAAEVIVTIVSPLLILWPCTKGIFSGLVFPKKSDSNQLWRGDYVMFENTETFSSLLMKQTAVFYLINGLKILASMIAAAILRRHLMVWKIFAPRFVYQAVSSFIVFGTCIITLLIIMRVNIALSKWVTKLNIKQR